MGCGELVVGSSVGGLMPVAGEVGPNGSGPRRVGDEAGDSNLIKNELLALDLLALFNGAAGAKLEVAAAKDVWVSQGDSVVFSGVHGERGWSVGRHSGEDGGEGHDASGEASDEDAEGYGDGALGGGVFGGDGVGVGFHGDDGEVVHGLSWPSETDRELS